MLTYKTNNKFQEGISFNDVYCLYEFDKKLRNMIMGVLETIEVAFRTQIAYTVAHNYGALGYMDSKNFIKEQFHADMIKQFSFEVDRSNELFIMHHKNNYEGNFPMWVVVEVASFGLLSKIYSNLKNEDKSEIAKRYYQIPYEYIKNWLYTLSAFRNICAHQKCRCLTQTYQVIARPGGMYYCFTGKLVYVNCWHTGSYQYLTSIYKRKINKSFL